MRQKIIIILLSYVLLLGCNSQIHAQSLEVMVGHERLFADVQWLKFIDADRKWSMFSRTRATVDYDNNTDVFTGAYLNYTTKLGLGGSVVGRIGATGAASDVGLHFFKAKKDWMLFALASAALKNELEYSWFSIFRYTPEIKEHWKFYSSLELFNFFNRENHVFSVQRVRLGVDYKKIQFGIAGNFSEFGTDWITQDNLGVFLRKTF